MMREALDGDDLDARSGDGHHQAAGNGENHPHPTAVLHAPLTQATEDNPTLRINTTDRSPDYPRALLWCSTSAVVLHLCRGAPPLPWCSTSAVVLHLSRGAPRGSRQHP
ncbi:hypothetical protein GCM10028793_40010 [Nocardiopsis oceani]